MTDSQMLGRLAYAVWLLYPYIRPSLSSCAVLKIRNRSPNVVAGVLAMYDDAMIGKVDRLNTLLYYIAHQRHGVGVRIKG